MAADFIEEVYKYAKCMMYLKIWAKDFYQKDNTFIDDNKKEISVLLSKFATDCTNDGFEDSKEIVKFLSYIANGEKDMTRVADIITRGALPLMEKYVKTKLDVDVTAGKYRLISTPSGFLTLKNESENLYYCSMYDPMDEARIYCEKNFVSRAKEYAIFGCELGYHAYQYYIQSQKSVKVYIYEPDPLVVDFAFEYGVLSWIPEEDLEIITDDALYQFIVKCNESGVTYYINSNELQELPQNGETEAFIDALVYERTERDLSSRMEINTYRNLSLKDEPIDAIDKSEVSEDVFVIAAGPSLDNSIELLKRQKDKTIITVSTALGKLRREGIEPDYVVALDSSERMMGHFENNWDCEAKLVYGLNLYFGIAKKYKGKRYYFINPATYETELVLMNDTSTTLKCAGTVTVSAVDFAKFLGAKRIFLIGADMGYPEGVTHAKGTPNEKTVDTTGMKSHPGVVSGIVYADRTFYSYREHIEKQIKDYAEANGPEVYNLSTIGASIAGAIQYGDPRMPQEYHDYYEPIVKAQLEKEKVTNE